MDTKKELEEGTEPIFEFSKVDGLIPVVVQDMSTRQILMVAYSNLQAVNETLNTGHATFWSRSRKKLCTKGEESGNYLKVSEVLTDCDRDALVYVVKRDISRACHTKYEDGTARTSCFYRRLKDDGTLDFIDRSDLDRQSSGIGEVIEKEYVQIEDRFRNPKEGSSTTRTFQRPFGVERKILEEAGELTWASIGKEGVTRQISELADLTYTNIAYMVKYGIMLTQLGEEMIRRQK